MKNSIFPKLFVSIFLNLVAGCSVSPNDKVTLIGEGEYSKRLILEFPRSLVGDFKFDNKEEYGYLYEVVGEILVDTYAVDYCYPKQGDVFYSHRSGRIWIKIECDNPLRGRKIQGVKNYIVPKNNK